MAQEVSPGGFLRPVLPSPPPSVPESSIGSSSLPHPRHTPLRLGSTKETAFINHVDEGIARVQGRFAKRTGPSEPVLDGDIDEQSAQAAKNLAGYANFKEAGKDLESLVDIVWISATPSLQISYLLNLALLTNSVIQGFSPPNSRTMFRLLGKLDIAFASLLQGHDVESGEPLQGLAGRRQIVSGTEKVRMKGIVEKTRIIVTDKMGERDIEDEVEESGNEIEDDFGMDVARVYDRTIVELGDELGVVT